MKKFIYLLVIVTFFIPINIFASNEWTNSNSQNSKFYKDYNIRYNNPYSLKISLKNESNIYFYKNISVKPNTTYKFSAYIKTSISSGSNCQFFIKGLNTNSNITSSNTNWTNVSLDVNTLSNTNMNLYLYATGTNCNADVWFDKITLEEAVLVTNYRSNWKFLTLIIRNTNASINGTLYKSSMSDYDVDILKRSVNKLPSTLNTLSNGKMSMTNDIYVIDGPVTRLSPYVNNYWVPGSDISEYLDYYLTKKNYDHINVIVTLNGDRSINPILNMSWGGLGGTTYKDIPYSLINYTLWNNPYTIDFVENEFAYYEAVYVHEFLHTLERIAQNIDSTVPNLHDSSLYGYVDVNNWRSWYYDYMNKNIYSNNTRIGLPSNIYNLDATSNYNYTLINSSMDVTRNINTYTEDNGNNKTEDSVYTPPVIIEDNNNDKPIIENDYNNDSNSEETKQNDTKTDIHEEIIETYNYEDETNYNFKLLGAYILIAIFAVIIFSRKKVI